MRIIAPGYTFHETEDHIYVVSPDEMRAVGTHDDPDVIVCYRKVVEHDPPSPSEEWFDLAGWVSSHASALEWLEGTWPGAMIALDAVFMSELENTTEPNIGNPPPSPEGYTLVDD